MFDQLKNLKGLAELMGNAGELRQKFQQMQDELASKTVDAESGAGAVRVTVNGKLEVVHIMLDRTMITTLAGDGEDADQEMVEELIRTAVNAGMLRAKQMVQEEMSKIAGGMNLPGLDHMLGGSV